MSGIIGKINGIAIGGSGGSGGTTFNPNVDDIGNISLNNSQIVDYDKINIAFGKTQGQIKNILDNKSFITTTISELRLNNTPESHIKYYTTDIDKEGFWYYDSDDTSSVDNLGTILVSSENKRYKRIHDGVILSSWFGWVADGNSLTPTDNVDVMKAWLKASRDLKGLVNIKGDYLHSTILPTLGTIDIDMGGSTFVSPQGTFLFSSSSNYKASFTAGNYFTTVRQSMQFDLIAGVTNIMAIGDVVLLTGNTNRLPLGNYKHGQYAVVRDITATKIILNVDFYESYIVDNIYVINPYDVTIRNGIIDMKKDITGGQGFIFNHFRTCVIENIRAYGSKYSQAGGVLKGVTIRLNNYYAQDFIHIQGVSGSGGRIGYGMATNGSDVVVTNVSGSNCKHFITCNERQFMSLSVTIDKCVVYSPIESWNLLLNEAPVSYSATDWQGNPVIITNNIVTNQALYQGVIDAHANCQIFRILNSDVSGCNSMVGARCLRVYIENTIFRQNKVNASFFNNFCINIYEEPVEFVKVVNCTYVVLEKNNANPYASFIGIESGFLGHYQDIIVDGLNIEGGSLLSFTGSKSQVTANEFSFGRIIFRRVSGWGWGGILMQGNTFTPEPSGEDPEPASIPYDIKSIDQIIIDVNDFTINNISGVMKPVLEIKNVASVNKIKLSGIFDQRELADSVIKLTLNSDPIHNPTLIYSLPEIDCSGAIFHSGSKILEMYTSPGLEPKGANFNNATLNYNYLALNPTDNGEGEAIYCGFNIDPIKPWTYNQTVFNNINPESCGTPSYIANFSFPSKSKNDLNGIILDGDIIQQNDYYLSQLSKGIIPQNIRHKNGFIFLASKKITNDGRLWIRGSRQSNVETVNATPAFDTVDFVNQIVWNDSYSKSSPIYWIGEAVSKATITAIVSSGNVTGFIITNGGSYLVPPNIDVIGGTGQTFTPILTNNVISSINIAGSGTGYTSGVNISIVGTRNWIPEYIRDYYPLNIQKSNTEIFNDFVNCQSSAAEAPFSNSVAGTGASTILTVTNPENSRFGIKTLETGTQSNGRAGIGTNGSTLAFGGGEAVCEMDIKIPVLSDATESFVCRFCFGDSYSVSPTDGAYFEIDSNVDSNFICKTSHNGTTTSENSGVSLIAGNWYNLKVVVSTTTLSQFFINGILVATITTNIPNSTVRSTGIFATIVKYAGIGNTFLMIDYIYARKLLLTR